MSDILSPDEIRELFLLLDPNPMFSGDQNVSPQEGPIGSGNINPVGFVADGAISEIAQFASTIRPPVVVTSLPALPDSNHPQGSFVFLTTDQKLYRNTTGSAWSKAVDGGDIVADSITTGKIAAGVTVTGMIVIRTGDSTVIIDGTSNMFKISATGTLSGTAPTDIDTIVGTASLTGLGSVSVTPAHLVYISTGNLATDDRFMGVSTIRVNRWAAGSSGGPVTDPFIAIKVWTRLGVTLSAIPGTVTLDLRMHNYSGVSRTAYCRYYVLQEIGM